MRNKIKMQKSKSRSRDQISLLREIIKMSENKILMIKNYILRIPNLISKCGTQRALFESGEKYQKGLPSIEVSLMSL